MANQLQTLVAEKKDMVETVMEVFEQGAEVVASFVGDFLPFVSIAAPIVKLAFDNVESSEAKFMREQFQKVRDRLEVVSEDIQRINDHIKKSGVDITYFPVEENITNQFRKYMDILNAKPSSRDTTKKLFMDHFDTTGGEKNLDTLYEAVTGKQSFGEPLLEIILNCEEKSRRAMEEFCARLKRLFCIGLIALLGHAALKGYGEEEELLKAWGEKMKDVQEKMTGVIEDCIVSFPTQAQEDAHRLVRDQTHLSSEQLANAIVEKLKKKYDWVGWSVRVFKPSKVFIGNKEYHWVTGESHFQVSSANKRLVWVSYSSSPEPVDKSRIQELIQSQKRTSVKSVAESLFETLPKCVVHAIKPNDLACSWSFTEELHYWEKDKDFYVCVHSS